MAKATKKQALGLGLSSLLRANEVSDLKEEIKKIEAERDRLLSLVEKLTEALINK
mgnify:CR=1 FL=1